MPQYVVRRALPADIRAILPLWEELTQFHAALEPRFQPHLERTVACTDYLIACLHDEHAAVWVADAGGSLVGYTLALVRDVMAVQLPNRYGYLSDLVVTESWRRQGVATALLTAAQAWFRALGLEHYRVTVAHGNPTSQAFWRAAGCRDFMETLWSDL